MSIVARAGVALLVAVLPACGQGDMAVDEQGVLRAVLLVDEDVGCGPPINLRPETIRVRRGSEERLNTPQYREAFRSAVEISEVPLRLDEVIDDEETCFTYSNSGVELDAEGLVRARSLAISRPGFDRSRTYAVVLVAWGCGPDCGYMSLELHDKRGGRWGRVGEVQLIVF